MNSNWVGYVYTLVENVDTIFLPSLHLKHSDHYLKREMKKLAMVYLAHSIVLFKATFALLQLYTGPAPNKH